ncbi:MAG: hypothetical protein K2V38_05885, partial [Gemmataceae bacterium]|nr:hypothetical protein [Gemmataceae bacterium]
MSARLWHEEQFWRTTTRASELIRTRAEISERKWRLFGLACVREVLHLCPEPWQREVFEEVERIAESTRPGWRCKDNPRLNDANFWRQWPEWSGWAYRRRGKYAPPRAPEEIAAESALVDLALWSGGWTDALEPLLQGVLDAFTLPVPADADRAQAREE